MINLGLRKRDIFGRKARQLLKQGLIPGEVYGHGFENIHVSVLAKDFLKVFNLAGKSSLVNLILENESFPALIQDVAYDFLGGGIIHVDFHRIRMEEKVRTSVPVILVGESPAVKERGGNLLRLIDSIEVEALPQDLPNHIEIDLGVLQELNQSFKIKDINWPSGVKPLVDSEAAVVVVEERAKEELAVGEVASEEAQPNSVQSEESAPHNQ